MTDLDTARRPARQVPAAVTAVVAAAAMAVGLVAGYQLSATGIRDPEVLSVADDPVAADTGDTIVVDSTAQVVRTFDATVGEKLTLIHVPHIIVESWGDWLVSSDESVIEVLDDVTIRTVGAGSAELRIRTDAGMERPLYRVTVTE